MTKELYRRNQRKERYSIEKKDGKPSGEMTVEWIMP